MNKELSAGHKISEGLTFTAGSLLYTALLLGEFTAITRFSSELGFNPLAGLVIVLLGNLSYSLCSAVENNGINKLNFELMTGLVLALVANGHLSG